MCEANKLRLCAHTQKVAQVHVYIGRLSQLCAWLHTSGKECLYVLATLHRCTVHSLSTDYNKIMIACITLLYIQEVIPEKYLTDDTVFHLQPSGSFVVGGPKVGRSSVLIHWMCTWVYQFIARRKASNSEYNMYRGMLDWQDERLLWIPMVVGELMVGVPFLEKMQQRWIDQLPTLPVGLLSPLFMLDWPRESSFRFASLRN